MREAGKPYGTHQNEWYDGPPRKPHSMRLWLVGIAILAAIVVALATIAGKVKAQPTVALPFATVTSVGTSSVQIIGYNPSRRSIQICLAAVAQSVTFVPAPLTPVSLTSGITIVGSATAPPPCFSPPAYLLASGTAGGAGSAWNAIASGTINVTVLEW